MRRFLTSLFLFLVFVAALVLGWLNTGPVTLNYILDSAQVSLVWVLFLSLFFGWLLGLATSLLFIFRLRRELANLRKEKRVLETEVNNLRNLPIRDVH